MEELRSSAELRDLQELTYTPPDLRAGAALVIAGLSAKGFTTVSDIGYIYRGYEQFEQKLKQLGGEIQLVNNEKEVAKFKLKIG